VLENTHPWFTLAFGSKQLCRQALASTTSSIALPESRGSEGSICAAFLALIQAETSILISLSVLDLCVKTAGKLGWYSPHAGQHWLGEQIKLKDV